MGFVAQCVPDGSHDGTFWGVWYEFILSRGRGDWEVDGVYRGTGKNGSCATWWSVVSGLVFMGRFLLLRSEPIEMIP